MKDLISLIYRGIQSEYEAIQIYKEVANEARQLGKPDVASIFDEISRDEMQHIGNLEELLKTYLPEDYAELNNKASEGHEETKKDLAKDSDENTGFELASKCKEFLMDFVNVEDLAVNLSSETGNASISIHKHSLSNPLELFNTIRNSSIIKNNDIDVMYNKDTIDICIFG